MKKISMYALAGLSLLPTSMMAVEKVDTVKTKSEFTTAISATADLKSGDVYKIVCKWDAADVLNIGNVKPNMTAGKLIITSDETDFDKMPQMLIGFDWAKDIDDAGNFALVFENVGLQYRAGKEATSGQIVYINKKNAQMDSVVFRNCDLNNYPRTVYRSVPKSSAAADVKGLGKFVMEGCRVHDGAITSGNNWAVIYPGQAVQEVVIKNNMFYNLPYTTAIFQMGYASEGTGTTPTLTFENNSVFQAASSSQSKGFTAINTGAYFGAGSTFNINNNLFIAPVKGVYASEQVNDEHNFTGKAKVINADQALVYAKNNVVDATGFMPIADCNNTTPGEDGVDHAWLLSEIENSYSLEEAGITSWEEGVVFQDAPASLYYMQKSAKAYTLGTDGTYLGAAMNYVDAFPVKAAVNIKINGPEYISYSLTPDKAAYYIGDEVTVTLQDHNNAYMKLNTFDGWSDGDKNTTKTFTLTGDLNETLNFKSKFSTEKELISAFDFSKIVKNGSVSSYDADINLSADYASRVQAIVNDTTEATGSKVAPFTYVNGNFQTRPAKFGEDSEEMQMPIISRRTWSGAKATQRDYALFTLSTKNLTDVNFSCYVGSDNNAAKVQALELSTDSATWTRLSEVELENCVWSKLAATLPAEANNKDVVYLRVIGDMKNGPVVTPDEAVGMWDGTNVIEEVYNAADAFEYLGSVLITANATGAGAGITNVATESADANAPIYNLMGMKVAKGTKGILIQNGRKFVVK